MISPSQTITGAEAFSFQTQSPSGNSAVERPGISASLLAKAGIREVGAVEAFNLVGYNSSGLAIPYRTIAGDPLSFDGKPFYRLRLHVPTNSAKYLSPRGGGCQLYISPGLRALLLPGCTLGVVEGEFKSLALVEAGFPCVGIGGISSACPKGDNGEPELLPALAALVAEVRPTRLAFIGDSDTAFIGDFAREAVKIAKLAGVPVVLPRIPIDAPGKGPDDLREVWREEFPRSWQKILEAAEPVAAGEEPCRLAVRLLRREAAAIGKLSPERRDWTREKLVKLAASLAGNPLAAVAVEEIAADSAGLPRQSLRAAVEQLHKKEAEAKANRKPPGESFLLLPGGDLSILEAATKVFEVIAPRHELFYRGGRVHEVVANSDGSRHLKPVSADEFRSRLEAYGKVFAWRAGSNPSERVLKPALCSADTAEALMQSTPARTLLPNVTLLSACPILAKDGEEMRVLGPGWHNVGGGMFVTGGANPSRLAPEEAVRLLSALLADFHFATPGDRSRAIASFLAPALRFGGWLTGHLPIDVGEADQSQSGKTFRQKLVAAVYRETPNLVAQRSGGVGGLDESLQQKLIDGRPFVLFDNLRGKLDSPFLEALLTAPDKIGARVPHRGEVLVDPRGFVFFLTSNGVETTKDLANRASIVRIRKRPEDYGFRAYPEGDVFDHVVANQPLYLGAVFSVLADWVQRGRPQTTETRHSFREWARTLDWIVQNTFGAAPLLDGLAEARERVSDPRRIWIRALCIRLREARQTGELIASQLAEFCVENELLPPSVGADADQGAVSRQIGKVMAALFVSDSEFEIDGYRIRREGRYSSTAQKEIPHYSFA